MEAKSSPGPEITTPTIQKVPRPDGYKPTPLTPDKRVQADSLFSKGETLGGVKLEPFQSMVDPDAQDTRIAHEFKQVIGKALGQEPGEQRTQNVKAIVDKAREIGVDTYDLADTLVEMGEDPDAYLPEIHADASLATDAAEPSVVKPEANTEQEMSSERMARLQQEVAFVGQRMVTMEIGKHVVDNKAANGYMALKSLTINPDGTFSIPVKDGKGPTYGKDKPMVLSEGIAYKDARLPQVQVNIDGKMQWVGVREISGLTADANGKKIARIQYETPNSTGKGTDVANLDVSLQSILDGQIIAEQASLSQMFSGEQRDLFNLSVAAMRGGKVAEGAFKDVKLPKFEQTLLKTAQELGMITRADVQLYVRSQGATLERDEKGELVGDAKDKAQELQRLWQKTADISVLTSDVVADIVSDGVGIDTTQVQQQLADVEGFIQIAQDSIRAMEKSGTTIGNKDYEATLQKLDAALKRQRELQLFSQAEDGQQKGTLEGTVELYFSKLRHGEISQQDAAKVLKEFREGDLLGFLERVNPMKKGEKESADEFAHRIHEENERRKKLLAGGKGAGILVLILASLATAVVDSGAIRQ